MKEMHAYRNDDGTYTLEVIAEILKNDELEEVKIVYPSVDVTSDEMFLKPTGELFRFELKEGA